MLVNFTRIPQSDAGSGIWIQHLTSICRISYSIYTANFTRTAVTSDAVTVQCDVVTYTVTVTVTAVQIR